MADGYRSLLRPVLQQQQHHNQQQNHQQNHQHENHPSSDNSIHPPYQLYTDLLNGEDGKYTFPQRLITFALTINSVALILSMSVIVVVVTLTMSLVTQQARAVPSSPTTTRPLSNPSSVNNGRMSPFPFKSVTSASDRSGSNEGGIFDDDVDPVIVSQAFGQLLALSPLFIISSLMGLSASQKTSSTGTIVCYWLTLTSTLLVTIYVTAEFVDYENFFESKEDGPSMPAVEAVSRLVVLIGVLQMMAAILITIAKYQKKRVAVKEPSMLDLNNSVNILVPNQENLVNQGNLMMSVGDQLPNNIHHNLLPSSSSTFQRVIQARVNVHEDDELTIDDVMMIARPVPAPSVTLIKSSSRDQDSGEGLSSSNVFS